MSTTSFRNDRPELMLARTSRASAGDIMLKRPLRGMEGSAMCEVDGGRGRRHYVEGCAVEGCTKPPRSMGAQLCEMHYGRLRRNGAPEILLVPTMELPVAANCIQCKDPISNPVARRFCSERCQARWRRRRHEITRSCVECGGSISSSRRADSRYCSNKCLGKAWRKTDAGRRYVHSASTRRRLQRQAQFVAAVNPRAVFERDGWKCQLCGGSIDSAVAWPHPQSASVDHVLPLSRGGTHEPANCQAAHLACNQSKHDRYEVA